MESMAKKTKLTEEQRNAIARALSDPSRFAILQQIAAQESMYCNCLDAKKTLSAATVSHHIKGLVEAGLIDVVHEGRVANMKLRRDTWNAYLNTLAQI